MKIIFDGLLSLIIVVLILGLSLLIFNYLLDFLFFVIDYNAFLGATLAISLLVMFALVSGLAKTREYFPGIKRFIFKQKENRKKAGPKKAGQTTIKKHSTTFLSSSAQRETKGRSQNNH